MQTKKRVCIFCSSCNYLEKSYYDAAEEFGKLIAQNGFDMVYGGSSLGMMWACAKEVKKNGGEIIGVMPKKLHDMGVYTDECINLTVTPCMRTRKAKMDELSDCVVALAGGFGTLEEISEMIVQKQLGYNNKPVVFLNTNGFYNKLIEFFENIISENFANACASKLYYIAHTPKEAVNYLINYNYSAPSVTKEEIYARKHPKPQINI